MENARATSRPALWLMLSIILVALNLRPSMAAVGPLLSVIRGDIPLSFSLASLLTMLPVMAGFCGLILAPQHLSLLWPCLLGLGIGGLFPMSLIVSLDHLDDPQRAGGLTAFVQGIGYLIAGLSPLIAGMMRDHPGGFEWAWWSLTGVTALMLLMVLRFNPRHYARHIH